MTHVVAQRSRALSPWPYTLALALVGCVEPAIVNTTPTVVTRAATGRYDVTAQVTPRTTTVVGVTAHVDGVARPMTGPAAGTTTYTATHTARACAGTLSFWFDASYRRGSDTTLYTKREPAVGGFITRIAGAESAGCAVVGRQFFVDSTADAPDASAADGLCRTASGACTLRAAIMQANASTGHDLIELPRGTYTLRASGTEVTDRPDPTFGDLDVTDAVSVRGAGSDVTIVDGAGIARLFDVYRTTGESFVRIENLTLQGGYEFGRPGGAVFNRGDLQLHRVVVRANQLAGTELGGTCANSIAVRDCNRGGALFNEGQVLVTESTFASNTTTGAGTSGQGGAISNFGAGARLFVERSTFVGNTARFAGGIHNVYGEALVTNSTFAEHQGAWGHTLVTYGGRAGLNSVTVSGDAVGAALTQDGGGELGLLNSVVAINQGTLCAGTLQSSLNNYVGRPFTGDPLAGCTIRGSRPAVGTLLLSSLASNGGPTQTMRVINSSSSDALHPKDSLDSPCPDVDQRGFARPRDADGDGSARCDAGALEQ